MSPKYRVGIIASGRIAREHGRGWQGCEHTEIVAIADAHPQALADEGGCNSAYGDDEVKDSVVLRQVAGTFGERGLYRDLWQAGEELAA